MNGPFKMLAVAAAAAMLPMAAGSSASAAPLAQPLALKNVDVGVVQEAQYRHRGWRSGRWVGPAIGGFAAGVAAGALAPRYYGDYGTYAYAPGYAYAPAPYAYAPRYPRYQQFPAARCGDADTASAYPSWACPPNPRATGW